MVQEAGLSLQGRSSAPPSSAPLLQVFKVLNLLFFFLIVALAVAFVGAYVCVCVCVVCIAANSAILLGAEK